MNYFISTSSEIVPFFQLIFVKNSLLWGLKLSFFLILDLSFNIEFKFGQKHNFIDFIEFISDFDILRNMVSKLVRGSWPHVKRNIPRSQIKLILCFWAHNICCSFPFLLKSLYALNLWKILRAIIILQTSIFKRHIDIIYLLDRTIIVKSLRQGVRNEGDAALLVAADWALLITGHATGNWKLGIPFGELKLTLAVKILHQVLDIQSTNIAVISNDYLFFFTLNTWQVLSRNNPADSFSPWLKSVQIAQISIENRRHFYWLFISILFRISF